MHEVTTDEIDDLCFSRKSDDGSTDRSPLHSLNFWLRATHYCKPEQAQLSRFGGQFFTGCADCCLVVFYARTCWRHG